jgi:hypothetical protein
MHSAWLSHELVFNEDFLYSTGKRDRAGFAFGTLLSKQGCIPIASFFQEEAPLPHKTEQPQREELQDLIRFTRECDAYEALIRPACTSCTENK